MLTVRNFSSNCLSWRHWSSRRSWRSQNFANAFDTSDSSTNNLDTHTHRHIRLLYTTDLSAVIIIIIIVANGKSHTGYLSVPKSVTLSKLRRPNGCHYASFQTTRQFPMQTASNSLKPGPCCSMTKL